MLKHHPINFNSKSELFLQIGGSILALFAGPVLLLIGFGIAVPGFFCKEKISNTFDILFRRTFIMSIIMPAFMPQKILICL
jgi:hypothetical protein